MNKWGLYFFRNMKYNVINIIQIKEGVFLKKPVRIVLILLCVVFLGVFSFSAYKIISTLNGYKQAEKAYNNMSQQFVSTSTVTPTPVPSGGVGDGIDPEVSPISVDFEALRAQSTDAVGWIYSPDTPINYPIAYTDNNFYYLDHILGEEYNANGTIFIDCKCASDFSDKNTLVYGHNMNDGSMFASLRNYRDESYYPEHPVIYISTPKVNYRLDLIAGFVTEPTSFAYANTFDETEQFMHYIETIKSMSTFKSDVEVGPDDKVVTLSTCTYEINDGRYVVVGKLVQIH